MKASRKDLPAGRLSFTQIDTYLNCPKKYEWKYIVKPPTVQASPDMKIGSQLHELMASVLEAKMNKKKVNEQTLTSRSRQQLKIELIAVQGIVGKKNFDDVAIGHYLHQHDELYKKWARELLPELKPTAVEEKIEMDIAGYPFVMYIDLVDKGKRVIDWKVTKAVKSKPVVDNSLQLSIYSIGAEVDDVGFGALVRPREGKEKNWKPNVKITTGVRTKADRDWAVKVIDNAVDGIRYRSFPLCSPENFLCNDTYCDFYLLCRGKEKATLPKWMSLFG